MSTTQEVLHNEVSTFFEDTTRTNNTEERRGLIEGDYLGHIIDTRTVVKEFTTKDGRDV